jgi:hypothetical protein
MSFWWMSFCDPDRPEGDRFIGALVIRADNAHEMIDRSWALDLNPGGEIAFFEIPKQYEPRIPPDWIETRLLTKTECETFDAGFAP